VQTTFLYQIPQARPAARSAFRYKQNATVNVVELPDLPSANPAVQHGSRRIFLVAKNRSFRRVNLRDSLGHATRVVVNSEK